MKKFVPVILLLVFLTFVFFKLKSNKKKIDQATALAETTIEEIPVRIYEVQPIHLSKIVKISGQLSPKEDLMLISATQGHIRKVYKEKGDWVNKGDLIVSVEDELYREEYEITKSAFEKLKKDLERFKRMEETDAVTAQQREGVELNLKTAEAKYLAAKKQLEDAHIRAPLAGFINQLFVKNGGLLGKGAPVCEVVNTKSLMLKIKASEYDLPDISRSSDIKVVVPTYPNDTLNATIQFQSVKADYSSLFEIELLLEENKSYLKAGMLGIAHFFISAGNDQIFIPQSAILGFENSGKYVFLENGEIAERQTISTGSQYDDYIEVSDGLKLGDRVITEGNTIVRTGQSVKVVDK